MSMASLSPQQKDITSMNTVVDIGINLTHKTFHANWRSVVQRAIDAGVTRMVLTGTSIDSSRKSLELAQTWLDETGTSNLYATVGVHPHDAKTWNDTTTLKEMRDMLMLQHPLAVAVGRPLVLERMCARAQMIVGFYG